MLARKVPWHSRDERKCGEVTVFFSGVYAVYDDGFEKYSAVL